MSKKIAKLNNHYHWIISFVTEAQKGGRKEYIISSNEINWQDILFWERELKDEFYVTCKVLGFSLVKCDCFDYTDDMVKLKFDKDL